ncbi:hypothetical protein B0H14DRAFT_2625029 [Mycena olivaceomarginata]|nr:hypothetical protein B0H14DRAFT_2625029 [Mycena olivaceomarginata]
MACFRSCRQLKCYYGLNPLDLLSGNQFLASWSSLESGPLILPAQTLGAYAGSQRTSLRLCDSLRATYDHRGSAETAGARRNSTLVLSLRDQVVNIACTAEGVRICRIPADLLRSAFFCAPPPHRQHRGPPPSNTSRLAAKRTFSAPYTRLSELAEYIDDPVEKLEDFWAQAQGRLQVEQSAETMYYKEREVKFCGRSSNCNTSTLAFPS